MAYDSPRQIRNRQERAEAKALHPRRKRTRKLGAPDAEKRAAFIADHSAEVARAIETGDARKAGLHAATLAHGILRFRALEIQAETRCIWHRACQVARVEIYGDLRIEKGEA